MESLYEEAANVIELAKKKKGSIKGLCFASSYRNKKKLYALVCQTIKYKSITSKLLEKLEKEGTDCMVDKNMQLVLSYDILFGKGIRCGGKIGEFSKQNQSRLFELLEEFQKDDANFQEDVDNSIIALPRYVRVNTIKNTVDEVIAKLIEEGWKFIDSSQEKELDEDEFTPDNHIPEVLVFSNGTDLHRHPLYINGNILLQDKASCLPAFLLKPKQKSTVIDACAAPGNKTTHLSSIMNNNGKIFAFDLDKKRLTLLKEQIRKAGTQNVEAMHQDFLKTNPQDERFKNVKYILLDPSCSGSGMVSRMDRLVDDQKENMEKLRLRLESLSKFQYAMLCHALSFPKVNKVAYSTCSIHQQENEVVVERAMKRFGDKFSLLDLMPSWTHRGKDSFSFGSSCLRASPEIDKTNGFFVVVFKRKKQKSPKINEEGKAEKNTNHELCTEGKKSGKRKLPTDTNGSSKQRRLNGSCSKQKRRKRQLKKPVTST